MNEPIATATPEASAPPKSRSGPLWILLAAILILCLVTCVFSVRTSQMAKQAMEAAGVSPTGQTQEDDVAIMETTGIRQRYTARDPDTNVPITGYALVCYVRAARRIYLLHFTAPTREYDELSTVIDVIRESMSTT